MHRHRNAGSVAVLLALAACGSSSPVGSWVCDAAGTVNEVKKMLDVATQHLPADTEDNAARALQPLFERAKFADSRFELRADHSCSFEARQRKGDVQRGTGTWQIAGERVTITLQIDGEDEPMVLAAEFEDDELAIVEEVAAKEVRTRFRRAGG